MRFLTYGLRLLKHLASEDRGQDLVEYALLSTFITVTGVAIYATLRSDMQTAYTDWNTGAQTQWEPCAPNTSAPGSTCY